MNRSVIAVFAVLALAGALAAFLWLGGDSASSAAGTLQELPAVNQPGDPGLPSSTAPEDVAPISGSAFQGERDVAATAGIVIHCVDEQDHPVADATIQVYRGRDTNDPRPPGGPPDARRKVLKLLTADPLGVAVLDSSFRRSVQLVGRAPQRAGELWIDPIEAMIEQAAGAATKLVLKPVKALEVTVLDGAGAPVPFMRVRARAQTPDFFQRPSDVTWTAAPTGIASFEVTALDGGIYAATEATVEAVLAGADPVSATVPWIESGVTKVTLRVPPVVTVNLRVKPAQGDVLPDEMELGWQVDNAGGSMAGGMRSFFMQGAWGSRRFKGPTTSVAGFSAGAAVTFTLNAEAQMSTEKKVTLPPDAREYELVMEPGPRQPILLARLVDDRGTPVTQGTFNCIVTHQGEEAENAPEAAISTEGIRFPAPRRNARNGFADDHLIEPDQDGAVRIPVKPDLAGTVKISDQESRPWLGATREDVLAEKAFEALTPGATKAIGDVVVPRKPLLVAGRVKSAAGKPVPYARVILGDDGVQVRGRPAELLVLLGTEVRAGADGAFEIRAHTPPGGNLEGLRAYALGRKTRSKALAFTLGQPDLELVVEPTSSIAGSIRRVPPELEGTIDIAAVAPGSNNSARGPRARPRGPRNLGGGSSAFLRKDGAFELKDLAAGTWDVLIRWNGDDVMTVSGVEVPPDTTVKDPRLQSLAIGSEFLSAVVTVLAHDGNPVARADVQWRFQEGDRSRNQNRQTDAAGHATHVFVVPPQKVSVIVRADGYGPKTVEGAAFPLLVRLDPPIILTVLFDLEGGLPAVAGVKNWRLRARPVTEEDATGAAVPGGLERGPMRPRGGAGPGTVLSATVAPGATSVSFKGAGPGVWRVDLEPTGDEMEGIMRWGGPSVEVVRGEIPRGVTEHRMTAKFTEAAAKTMREMRLEPAQPIPRPPGPPPRRGQ